MGVETLAIVSVIGSVVGAGVSMAGQAQQAAAMENASAYQAGVARNNQILANRAADDAIARGKVQEMQARREAQRLIGRQRAVLAANGVQVDDGSAADITSDTAMIGELDALTIRSNAEREALGYQTQGMNFGAQAQLAGLNGQGGSGIASTALGGLGSVAEKWYSFSKAGAFGGGGYTPGLSGSGTSTAWMGG